MSTARKQICILSVTLTTDAMMVLQYNWVGLNVIMQIARHLPITRSKETINSSQTSAKCHKCHDIMSWKRCLELKLNFVWLTWWVMRIKDEVAWQASQEASLTVPKERRHRNAHQILHLLFSLWKLSANSSGTIQVENGMWWHTHEDTHLRQLQTWPLNFGQNEKNWVEQLSSNCSSWAAASRYHTNNVNSPITCNPQWGAVDAEIKVPSGENRA